VNSLLLLLLSVVVVVLGFLLYSKRVDRKVIRSDPDKATPATMYMDGVDFTPTSRNVLFGYQFKSIAALGPIVGVIIALQWGWLPALLWLLVGVLFIGWVHDYTSAMISIRSDGQTFRGLTYQLIFTCKNNTSIVYIFLHTSYTGSFWKHSQQCASECKNAIGYNRYDHCRNSGRSDDPQMEAEHYSDNSDNRCHKLYWYMAWDTAVCQFRF